MSLEDNILIEMYLDNSLSDQERKVFEVRLNTDAEFYNEFILEKQLLTTLAYSKEEIQDEREVEIQKYKDALKGEDLKSLSKTLSEIGKEFNSEPKKVKKLWYYVAAASIVALLGFQLFFNTTDSNLDLYYDNVGLTNLPSFATRDASDSIQVKLNNGEQQFKQGNYKESLNILEPLLEVQNNNLIFIYVGLAQTELNLYQESENTFNTLENSSNNFSANWYKALLFIKQEKIDSALEQLNIILEHSNSLYFAKASELSESLKSNN